MPRPLGPARVLQRVSVVPGRRYGNLTVLREAEAIHVKKWRVRMVEARCDCGDKTVTRLDFLRRGHTTSCGCKRREPTNVSHGQSKTRLYAIWNGMRQRCENPNQPSYVHYGRRGVKVCEEWQAFEPF